MLAHHPLPGSTRHQSLLQTIIERYENDDRILALLIFGSLGQDRSDAYSDLDLEVVIRDGVSIDMPREVERVSAAFTERGERTLFT